MRSIIDFIKYNNAFLIILAVILLGTGAAFAANPKLREAVMFSDTTVSQPFVAPKAADAANLLKADIDEYDISVRIDKITETKEMFAVEYSYNTYDIVGGIWQETRKNRRLDVPKALLGKRKLTEYLSEQIGQIVYQEIAYLDEVRTVAVGEDTAKPRISKYAGLVGKELSVGDGKSSNVGEMESEEKRSADDADEDKNSETLGQGTLGISDEKLREMIVQAVAEFLAIDMSMPEPPANTELTPIAIPEAETVKPDDQTVSSEETPSEDEAEVAE